MSSERDERICVTNWFTKKFETPSKDLATIKNTIKRQIIANLNRATSLQALGDAISDALDACEDLLRIPSDTRLPVCALYNHLKITAGIAVCLALDKQKEYNLTDEDICVVRIGSLFHDIGKLDVFARNENFTRHPECTEKFIRELLQEMGWSERLEDIVHIASRHHTPDYYGKYRVTGSPLEQIVSLADTVASAADRSYEIKIDGEYLVSDDDIFPHVFTLGNKEKKIIWSNEKINKKDILAEKDRGGNSWYYDDVVHGGVIEREKEHSTSDRMEKEKIGLLRMDIMEIQRVIKEAKKLPALRGGSRLIKEVEECARNVIKKEVCPEAIIYSGGGNFLAFVPITKQKEIVDEIKNIIESKYQKNLLVVVDCVEKNLKDVSSKFTDSVTELIKRLSEKKNEKYMESITIERIKSTELCSYCCKRQGSKQWRDDILCEFCYEKVMAGSSEADEFESIYRKLGLKAPESLNNVGKNIAVIICDGNSMGRLFKKTATPSQYTFKSSIFDKEFRDALKTTIEQVLNERRDLFVEKDENGQEYAGIVKIYQGGDDALLIINAKGALYFAQKFLENIKDRFYFTYASGNMHIEFPVITVSCGIAFGRSTFPVYFLIEKAEELLGEAKNAFRKALPKHGKSTLQTSIVWPTGALAYTSLIGATTAEKHYTYVFPQEQAKWERLQQFIGFDSLEGWHALLSELVNIENSTTAKLHYVKYMHACMDRRDVLKKAAMSLGNGGTPLDVVRLMCGDGVDKNCGLEMKEELEMLMPIFWGD